MGALDGLAQAGASLGIPQEGVVPGSGGGGLEDILSQLTSGQLSPEKLLMLLALLTGGGGAGAMPPSPPPPGMGGGMGGLPPEMMGGMPPGMMGGGGMPPPMDGPQFGIQRFSD